jgi:hypothetical protein
VAALIDRGQTLATKMSSPRTPALLGGSTRNSGPTNLAAACTSFSLSELPCRNSLPSLGVYHCGHPQHRIGCGHRFLQSKALALTPGRCEGGLTELLPRPGRAGLVLFEADRLARVLELGSFLSLWLRLSANIAEVVHSCNSVRDPRSGRDQGTHTARPLQPGLVSLRERRSTALLPLPLRGVAHVSPPM